MHRILEFLSFSIWENSSLYQKRSFLLCINIQIIIIISFMYLFYWLFFSKISSCSDLYHTIEILLFQFENEDSYEADQFLKPVMFRLWAAMILFCTRKQFRLKNRLQEFLPIPLRSESENSVLQLLIPQTYPGSHQCA